MDEEYLRFLAQEDADLGEVNPYGFFPQDFRYPRNTLTQNIPIAITQNPAMVNYGIGTLPQFDMANLPMYEKDDSEQEYIPGTGPQESGIAKIFQFLGNLPTPFNLARRGLESLRGFNDRIQQSDFGQSRNLMDYLDIKKYGSYQDRENARARTMAQARGIQKKIDRGDFGGPSASIDRGRTPQAREAAIRSRDLTGGPGKDYGPFSKR